MKRQKILFFTGLFLILIPLLGFPMWFKHFSTIIIGIFICLFSYTARGAIPFFRRKQKEASPVPEAPVLDIRPDEQASSHILRLDNDKTIH